jgi:hypothetical protein
MDAGWAIVVKCQGKVVRTMWRRIYERWRLRDGNGR